MAISKPLPLPLVAFITIHLVLLMMTHRVNSSEEVTFSFDRFQNDLDITLEGDASFSSSNEIRLTKVNDNGTPAGNSVGRASYFSPIRLWDSSTGEVANISTSFNFFVQAPYDETSPADGLAFFIAPHDSTLPSESYGGLLGLFTGPPVGLRKSTTGFKASSDNIVAVEFDTYTDHGYSDPDYKHIGIDVNSIISKTTTEWRYWRNGVTESVTITYNPVDKKLSVVASYPSGDRTELTYDIDLTTVLPEWVKVGFSGSTGLYTQVNNIQSWSFNSNLVKIEEEGKIASVV